MNQRRQLGAPQVNQRRQLRNPQNSVIINMIYQTQGMLSMKDKIKKKEKCCLLEYKSRQGCN